MARTPRARPRRGGRWRPRLRAGSRAPRRRRRVRARLEPDCRPYAGPHLEPSLLRAGGGEGAVLRRSCDGWSTSVIAPPDGSMGDYLRSLEKLLKRDDATFLPTTGRRSRSPSPSSVPSSSIAGSARRRSWRGLRRRRRDISHRHRNLYRPRSETAPRRRPLGAGPPHRAGGARPRHLRGPAEGDTRFRLKN